LKHDGKLFRNKRTFDRRAQKTNRYLQEWESTGFTSPSMHHNLSWLNALNITHSDYMNFNGLNNKLEKYSVELYHEFLKYVKQKYKKYFWNVLAVDIAPFMRDP
jgi:hypothetical protein